MARQKPTYRPKIGFSRFSNTLGFCVLGLIQSSTVLYLGSYKVVGEVVEFNWWRTENQRFRKKKLKTGYRQRIDICTSSARFQPVTFYLQAALLHVFGRNLSAHRRAGAPDNVVAARRGDNVRCFCTSARSH